MSARNAAAALFVISALASIGFAVAYASDARVLALGILLASAFGCIAFALSVWEQRLIDPVRVVEERPPLATEPLSFPYPGSTAPVSRQNALVRLLATCAALLGIAALFPLASLGPPPSVVRARTKWKPNSRLVRADGSLVRGGDIALGSVLTVFPEGFAGDAQSQTLLLRLPPDAMQLPPQRRDWAPQGYAAFSKICTHAGCPVGLYHASAYQLLCPCHQSAFDVIDGAKPVSGPAPRPLPQLPLAFDVDGYLHAQSDYLEPIGPDAWNQA